MTNAILADLIRRIQYLSHEPNKAPIEVQELEFYKSLYEALGKTFEVDISERRVLIELKGFPFERAFHLTFSLGLILVHGDPGTTYLSW